MTEGNKCGCGRSPTGKCIGWHSLSEEDYIKKKEVYIVIFFAKLLD